MDIFSAYNRLPAKPEMKKWSILVNILNPVNLLSALFAFQCSYLISYSVKGVFFLSDNEILKLFLLLLPFWLITLSLVKISGIPIKRYKVLFFLYLQSSVFILILQLIFCYLFRLFTIPFIFIAGVTFFGFLFFFYGRVLIHKVFKLFGLKGYNHTNIIIIADNYSLPFIENLYSQNELGYKVVVIFTESVIIKDKFENSTIILPERYLGILSDLIEVDFVDEVLYIKENVNAHNVRDILRTCEDLGVSLRLKYEENPLSISSAVKTDIADGKFLSFINIPNNTYSLAIKKTIDINLAFSFILISSPLLLIISLLIKLTSRGPLINNMEKNGLKGRIIDAYRFRTVHLNFDQKTTYLESEMKNINPVMRSGSDPRFTRIGRFLFKSGLDQLPEFFNVLKGELSLSGQWHPLQNEDIKFH